MYSGMFLELGRASLAYKGGGEALGEISMKCMNRLLFFGLPMGEVVAAAPSSTSRIDLPTMNSIPKPPMSYARNQLQCPEGPQ